VNDVALEFLRTGALDGVRVGAQQDEVVGALGHAGDSAQVDANTEILRYGDRELTVTGGRVTGIAVTGVDGDTSPRDVGALLLEAGIDWAVERELTFDKQLCLRADSGVLVLLDLERGSLQRLISEGSPLGFVDAGSCAIGRRRSSSNDATPRPLPGHGAATTDRVRGNIRGNASAGLSGYPTYEAASRTQPALAHAGRPARR